jgi:hypothetical protein
MSEQEKRLTDEDLARIERCLPPREGGEDEASFGTYLGEHGQDRFSTWDVQHLVDEVRRLRAERDVRDGMGMGSFAASALVGAVFQQQELDRLRSDEWLRAAARDIGEGVTRDGWNGETLPSSEGGVDGDILAILKKHRDGRR